MSKKAKGILIGVVIVIVALAAIHVTMNWQTISEGVMRLHGR